MATVGDVEFFAFGYGERRGDCVAGGSEVDCAALGVLVRGFCEVLGEGEKEGEMKGEGDVPRRQCG